MKNIISVFITFIVLVALSSCTKKSVSPDHYYTVGDSTFSGSYVQLGFAGADFNEKDVSIPTKRNIVWISDYKNIYRGTALSNDSFYLYVVDSFGTYGLGGNTGNQYVATAITFACKNKQTGNCKIGSGEINKFNPFVHYDADVSGVGFVNVFHNDDDFIQGTITCPFYNNGLAYSVSGSFKFYKR